MMEEYRAVKGFEGFYEVSNLGNVKSLARKSSNGKQLKEKMLKPGINSRGYLTLVLHKDGNKKCHQVHQLVAMAFLNHTPNGYKTVIDHIDNYPLNNRVENLQLISHRENCTKDKIGYSSKYVGVTWYKPTSKWRAQIKIDGKNKHIGLFSDELEASNAYQSRLKEITKVVK